MTCRNLTYQKLCAETYKAIPCCQEIDKDYLPYSLSPSNSPDEMGLVVQIFELGKVFVEKKLVKFRSHGTCMYPCIRPGDTLQIEPKIAEQIQIGDIAVYRRSNRLFTHRAIDKGENNSSHYILTRPDTARYGNEGPIFDEDILGIVSSIKRKTKILSPAKKDPTLVKRIFIILCLKWYRLEQYLFEEIISAIAFMQQFKVYRKITSLLFSRSSKKTDFSIHVPASSKMTTRFYRKISPQELVAQNVNARENSIPKWTITLNVNSKPAAFLSFVYRPQDCPFPGWWMCEVKIRIRYRGTGIEDKLFDKVEGLLRQSGISQIFVSFFEGEHLNRMLFENLGFRKIRIYEEDNLFKDKNNQFITRVIMQKEIPLATVRIKTESERGKP